VQNYPHSVLVVSHDRAFLDQTVTRILYLDPDTRTLKSYVGNYSDYTAARQHEHELHVEAYKKQQDYVARVQNDILRLKAQALNVELASTPKDRDAKFFLSGKGGSKKVAQKARARERKLDRYLDSDERVDRPKQHWNLKLDFGPAPPSGRAVMRVGDLSFAYGGVDPLFEHVSFDVQYGERIALVGPNGAGKTTLLRLLQGQLAPQTGAIRIGSNVRLGVLAQEHETLDLRRTVLETALHERPMSETEARSFLHFFLFGGDSVFRRVGECSLGERSRLQLALLVLRGCNLLLLDEPLNHLDIEGREHFERALEEFEGTVIAVAHDRAFLHSFAERVIEVRNGTVRVFEGDYEGYLWEEAQRKSG
jgi:ATP-binding cassette subfamily F protein 3